MTGPGTVCRTFDEVEVVPYRDPRASELTGVFVLALLYFAVGCTSFFDLVDEGQLVYAAWRVAAGEIPYRDFIHVYAPSPFLLNGALFRLFGADLLVSRLSLVVVKALIAVLVYACARKVAAPRFAVLVTVLFVAVAGMPWAFNSPYPNHYAVGLVLAGLLSFLSCRRFWAACLTAGLLFGAAATFKQTVGVFAAVWFALFLLMDEPASSDVDRFPETILTLRASILVRWLVIAGALLVVVAYQAKTNSAWNLLVVFAPFFGSVLLLGIRELRGTVPGWQRIRGAGGVLCCAVGVLLPVLAYAIWYAWLGALPEIFFNVWSLPRMVTWFEPFPFPTPRTALCLTATLSPFAALWLWRWASERGDLRWRLSAAVFSGAFLFSLVLLWKGLPRPDGLLALLRTGAWYGDPFRVITFLPVMTVLAALWIVFVPRDRRSGRAFPPREILNARALFCFTGATSLVFFYPAADFWHVVMALPLFLPALAYELDAFHRAGGPAAWFSKGATVLSALFIFALASPFVHAMVRAQGDASPDRGKLARATAIIARPVQNVDGVADLVSHLQSSTTGDDRLFVLTGEHLFYFLSGLPSAVDREEFVFYAVAANALRNEARPLVSEKEIIEQLGETRARVIDRVGSAASRRLRSFLPTVATYVDGHYRVEGEFGPYRVLVPIEDDERRAGGGQT